VVRDQVKERRALSQSEGTSSSLSSEEISRQCMPETMRSKLINERRQSSKLSQKVKIEVIKRLTQRTFQSPIKALKSSDRKNNPPDGDFGVTSGSHGTGSSLTSNKKID